MSRARLHYLDNLRVFAMLFGILVHTCNIADFGWLELIQPISHQFRMGTFFAISGYFSALLLERQEVSKFVANRFIALSVPLTTCLLILNPVTLWLIYCFHNGFVSIYEAPSILLASLSDKNNLAGAIVWHLHLWFLISLLVYSLTAPTSFRFIARLQDFSLYNKIGEYVSEKWQPLIIAVITAGFIIFLRALFMIFMKPLGLPWIFVATLQYWPFYLLGIWLYKNKKIWERVHAVDMPLIAAALITWLVTAAGDVGGNLIHEALLVLRRTLTNCAVFFALLWIFRVFLDKRTLFSARLSSAIYSIYLFHYFVIYLIAITLMPIDYLFTEYKVSTFIFVATLTFIVTFLIHTFIISKYNYLIFLFNGRKNF